MQTGDNDLERSRSLYTVLEMLLLVYCQFLFYVLSLLLAVACQNIIKTSNFCYYHFNSTTVTFHAFKHYTVPRGKHFL